jgi:hypothetical protein
MPIELDVIASEARQSRTDIMSSDWMSLRGVEKIPSLGFELCSEQAWQSLRERWKKLGTVPNFLVLFLLSWMSLRAKRGNLLRIKEHLTYEITSLRSQ